ncbi:MAG: chorismate synthase [Anaerolineae bacterium]|nr:chorismate synthase [Anaerolineae bacterium]
MSRYRRGRAPPAGEFGITIGSYVTQIGPIRADLPTCPYAEPSPALWRTTCAVPTLPAPMRCANTSALRFAAATTVACSRSSAWVCPWDSAPTFTGTAARRAAGAAMMSVPAVKGVEIGPAFDNAARYGTEVHDRIHLVDGVVARRTNRAAGGLEWWHHDGVPIVVRAAQAHCHDAQPAGHGSDLISGEETETNYERLV